MFWVVIILAVFFAVNMGVASFAASFATAYGGKVLSQKSAGFLFVGFVILGSVVLGKNVAITLGQEIVPPLFIGKKALIVIFVSAGSSMFISNLMKIPQSTSLVTVAAIAGVGAYYRKVNLPVIAGLIPFWILLPLISYFITRYITGLIYPPRKGNFWVYERFIHHREKLKKFVIITGCYSAFSVGANNVANVAGPLIGLEGFSVFFALVIFAGIYGMGAFTFDGPLKTAGKHIVPLGLMTASIISCVSGTLMIFASLFGVPQSFVMLQMGAIFAVASLKHGTELTFNDAWTKKTLYTWTINPVLTFVISWGLCFLIIR